MLKNKCLTCFVFLILLFVIPGCKNRNDTQKAAVSQAPAAVEAPAVPTSNVSMHEAALNGQLEMVKDLLGKGLNVNLKDQDGRTPLMYASFNGYVEIIQLLIDNGAQVNVFDSYGRTPLMMASSGPYPEAVKILLDHKADPNERPEIWISIFA